MEMRLVPLNCILKTVTSLLYIFYQNFKNKTKKKRKKGEQFSSNVEQCLLLFMSWRLPCAANRSIRKERVTPGSAIKGMASFILFAWSLAGGRQPSCQEDTQVAGGEEAGLFRYNLRHVSHLPWVWILQPHEAFRWLRPHEKFWARATQRSHSWIPDPQKRLEIINVYCHPKPLSFEFVCCAALDNEHLLTKCMSRILS